MSTLNKKELAAKSIDFFLKKPSHQHVLWLNFALTYNCNSRCVMCSIWQKYKQQPGLAKKELTLHDIETLLASPHLTDLQGVSFTGGEPLLRKDFVEIAGLFINRYPNAIIGVATNGLNPSLTIDKIKQVQDKYNPKHFSVSLSLDGLNAKHDEIRGVPGAYKALNETIALLKSETDVNIGIDFTITPWNYRELLDVYRFTKEKNIKFLAGFAHNSGAYYGNTEIEFDWSSSELDTIEADMRTIVKDRISNESTFNKLIDPYAFYLSDCVRHQTDGTMHQRCYSGTHSLFLDPQGNVYPCIMLDRKLGNIKENGFDSIWTSSEASSIRDEIRSGKCGCWVACEAVPSMLRNFDFVKWNLKNKFINRI